MVMIQLIKLLGQQTLWGPQRVAEIIVQGYAKESKKKKSHTRK